MMFFFPLLVHLASAALFHQDNPPIPQASPQDASYTVNDIISRYKNLSSQTREVSFFRDQPHLDTSCVRSALDPILPQCLKKSINDIDPRERSSTAAKLSICEFQASQIEYPTECRTRAGYFFGTDSVDYTQCVTAMERKSQWWTTYSGYYQSIGDICLQESLPYEKDEIWDMFVGVTEHYENVFEVLKEYVVMSEKFKSESEGSFEAIQRLMGEMKESSERNKDQMDVIWQYVTKQMEKLSKLSVDVTEIAKLQSDTVESNILSFFQLVDDQFSQELDSLRTRFVTDLKERDTLMELSLESTKERLLTLQLLSQNSYEISNELNSNLISTQQTAKHLNDSLSEMDETVGILTIEVKDATELMTSFTGILEDNVLVRAMLFISQDFAMGVEMMLIIVSLSIVSFISFLMISWRINLFKYIGIFVVSIVVGSVLGTVFMLIGRVVNQELERQMHEHVARNITMNS